MAGREEESENSEDVEEKIVGIFCFSLLLVLLLKKRLESLTILFASDQMSAHNGQIDRITYCQLN